MKLMFALIILSSFSIRASVYAQSITLNVKNAPIEGVIKKIQKQTGFHIVYNSTLIQKIQKVTLSVTKRPLKEVLHKVFKNESISFEVVNKTIVLKPTDTHQSANKNILSSEAKDIEVRGRVTDSIGAPLVGVSVQVKGATSGTMTDENGMFVINVPVGSVLEISFVGYLTKEIEITGAIATFTIILYAQPQEIERVVITALGIKKAERALTYNVQEISNEDITRNKDANFMNALTGKVAGVTINASSAGIGGATRVILRGTKNLSKSNNALYVVDGIPIPNPNGGSVSGSFSGVVSGEGISSFNPEDIERISVLTGPSASALYGSLSANGVVLITTKKAKGGKFGVSFSHSSDFFEPFVLPKFQNIYGKKEPLIMESWGDSLLTLSSYHPKDFFQTGNNISNSISLYGGTEKSQTLFSVATNNASGIIPNNTFNRYNFYLRQTTKFTDRFSVDFGAMYVKLNDKNLISQGQYHNPIVPVYLFPPGDDISKYKLYQRYDPDRGLYTQFWPYGSQGLSMENPYWIAFTQANTNQTERVMLNASAKYEMFSWMDITSRVRVDNSNTLREVKRPAGTVGLFASEYGFYTTEKIAAKNTYFDVMANIKRDITSDLKFSANIGGSYLDDGLDGLKAGGNLTKVANVYSVAENTNSQPTQSYSSYNNQSVFATIDFEYKRWLFLNATGRNEWDSRLPKEYVAKHTYFYPSVGVSAVLTDALDIKNNTLSFAKVRASYAEVSSAPGFGLANPTYSLNNNDVRPAPFYNYRPENTRSYEVGLDLKFFRNKLSLNLTAYKSNTFDQLLTKTYPAGSKFTFAYYNAGNVENKGIEAALGYSNNFEQLSWSSSLIFSLNRNKIIRLSEGTLDPVDGNVFGKDSVKHVTAGNDLYNILTSGGSAADLYVTQALRYDNQGNLWINPVGNGIEIINVSPIFIGRTTPDYNVSWSNNVSWKNFNLGFLVDARVGGVGVSFTQGQLDAFGVSQQSAEARNQGGVEVYGKLYTDVENFYKTVGLLSGGQTGLSMFYVYSATNVRLREGSLGYTFPGTFLGGAVKDMSLTLTGRNLFMFYNKAPFDPESTASTGTFYQGVDYFRQPSYRSFGFSIKAKF